MKNLISIIKGHYSQSSLEVKILTTALLLGVFVAIFSLLFNIYWEFEGSPIILCVVFLLVQAILLYLVIHNKNPQIISYIFILCIILAIIPGLWFVIGGVRGALPLYYILPVYVSAILINKKGYKFIFLIQLVVVLSLIFAETKSTNLIAVFPSTKAHIAAMTYALIILIFLISFMTRYIMLEYNRSISELKTIKSELEIANKHLLQTTHTDELTQLHNRRYIMKKLENIIINKRSNSPAVIMIDIDHFKKINDQFGHNIGDEVLKTISSTLTSNLPQKTECARIGGEEFLILIEDTKKTDCYELSSNLCTLIENLKWDISGLKTTISIGLYIFNSNDSLEVILNKVDNALYNAKNSGRNKFVVYED